MIENLNQLYKELFTLQQLVKLLSEITSETKNDAVDRLAKYRELLFYIEHQLIKFFKENFQIKLKLENGVVSFDQEYKGTNLRKYKHTINDYWKQLYTIGFDSESEFDIIKQNREEIIKYIENLNELFDFISDSSSKSEFVPPISLVEKRLEDFEHLLRRYDRFLQTISLEASFIGSQETINYLLNATSLMPLVYTNNNSPIKGNTSLYRTFNCQFHLESTNSMRISFLKNFYNCFGCGNNGNQINYLMEYHRLSFENAVYLLAEIFMMYIPDNPFRSDEKIPLVEKYRETLTGDEYKIFLMSFYEQTKDSPEIEEKFSQQLALIERIKKEEYDPNYNFLVKPKRFFIEKQ